MKNQLRKRTQGFTIIEVMIVLAIAGLILAVILLAVPALQRNQRNNARQNDATHLSGLVADYIGNHGGQAPGAAANCAIFYGATENWSQLKSCKIVVGAPAPAAGGTDFVVATGETCNNGTPAPSTDVNAFIVAWQPETTGTAYTTCIVG